MKSPLESTPFRSGAILPAIGLVLSLCLAGCGKSDAMPNILLVTVDTLRADRLHCYGYALGRTPAVDSLSRRGLLFENCTAHASSTAPSLASLMTGLYPSEAGILNNTRPLSDSVETIAQRLAGKGYSTAAFISNFNLKPRMGFDRGFEHYDAKLDDREQNRSFVPERTAEKTTAAALAWLEGLKVDRPFFLWVHYQDPHGPYRPPEGFEPPLEEYSSYERELPILLKNWGRGGIPSYQAIGRNRSEGYYQAMYDGEVAFLDRQFERLLNGLENRGLEKKTAVVFTADHGESMGEHGYWFSHEQDLFTELIRVPLIVAGPGIQPGRRTDRVCHIDIFPTLMALTGETDDGEAAFRGRNILLSQTGKPRRPIYSETNFVAGRTKFTSVTVGRWKLIRSVNRKLLPSLFDIEADPEERHNLVHEKPDVVARMMQILKTEEKRAASRGASAPLKFSEEDRRALESLGYTGE